ncbi:MAG: CpcT/CpeT family chromophore lyase [Cellvibrionales bacterium]
MESKPVSPMNCACSQVKKLHALACGLALLVFAVIEPALAASEAVMERSYREFQTLLEGEFDNQEQYYFDRNLELPLAERHPRNHLSIARVDNVTDGLSLFYFRQYLDDDATALVRDQLLVTGLLPGGSGIRMDIFPRPEGELRGQWRLADLGSPRCTIHWQPELDHFVGRAVTPDCVGSEGDNGSTQQTVLLTGSEFSIFDWGLAADAALPAQTPATAFRNHRARVFTCWMSVTHPSGGGSTFRAGLKILDQGGRLWLASEEPETAVAGIKIRRVRWPSGNNRDSLVLYAHQPDQDKAVAYTWGDVDASRIAMNLRWMQASCTLSDDQRWPGEMPSTASVNSGS